MKYLLGGVAFAGIAGAIAIAHPGHGAISPPSASFRAGANAEPFELFRGQRIVLNGTVNGVATEMMLDSGAGITTVDKAFADRIGLKPTSKIDVQGAGGSTTGELANGVDLATGALDLRKATVMILDLSPIERAVGHKIPVVLGREAFKSSVVTIDFAGSTIRFDDPRTFQAPRHASRVELNERDRLPSVKLSLNGLPAVDADLDLGNGGTLSVAQSYWIAQPSLAALPHAQGQSGGVGGLHLSRRVTVPQVVFAGRRFDHVPATFNESPTALPSVGASIGIEMLKSFVVTIDTAHGAMYLQPSGKPVEFRRERAGLRTELVGDRLKVAYVSPDGPAAAAGLKLGDEIVAVDGRKVDTAYYERPDWTRLAAHQKVALDRADGTRVTVTLRDYY